MKKNGLYLRDASEASQKEAAWQSSRKKRKEVRTMINGKVKIAVILALLLVVFAAGAAYGGKRAEEAQRWADFEQGLADWLNDGAPLTAENFR